MTYIQNLEQYRIQNTKEKQATASILLQLEGMEGKPQGIKKYNFNGGPS